MTTHTIKSRTGARVDVPNRAVEQLDMQLRGEVALPDSDGFGAACHIWNGMIDRQPAIVARCRGRTDVVRAVEFVRSHDLRVSVRGGGHNVAGHAICEGGLMIDLSHMDAVHVDPRNRTVRVGPGSCWGDVDHETQLHNLTVPNGIVSTTGVAGLTLGGGFGWLSRKWGLTCDQLRAADVVTAEGEYVRASRDRHSKLFWGLRGGSGNFGIVTSFEFLAREFGPKAVAGVTVHPRKEAGRVFEKFRAVTADAPDELSCLLSLRNAPPAPFIPEEWHGEPVAAFLTCYAGPIDEGRGAVEPIVEFGDPIAHNIGPKPFVDFQQMLDSSQPDGRNYYWKSEYFDDLPDALGKTLIDHGNRATSPHSSVLLMHLGGAISREPDGENAVSHRDANYVLNMAAGWNEGPSAPHVDWARSFRNAVQPYAKDGSYINFMTDDEARDRVEAGYRESWDRLVELKQKWDPDNVFRVNQNIPPEAH